MPYVSLKVMFLQDFNGVISFLEMFEFYVKIWHGK
jgi:hypothetical protein